MHRNPQKRLKLCVDHKNTSPCLLEPNDVTGGNGITATPSEDPCGVELKVTPGADLALGDITCSTLDAGGSIETPLLLNPTGQRLTVDSDADLYLQAQTGITIYNQTGDIDLTTPSGTTNATALDVSGTASAATFQAGNSGFAFSDETTMSVARSGAGTMTLNVAGVPQVRITATETTFTENIEMGTKDVNDVGTLDADTVSAATATATTMNCTNLTATATVQGQDGAFTNLATPSLTPITFLVAADMNNNDIDNANQVNAATVDATTVETGDGTAAAPAHTFSGATNMGVYRSGDKVSIASDANLIADFEHTTANRGTFRLITPGDNPNDFKFLNNGSQRWALTSRDSTQNNDLRLYAYDQTPSGGWVMKWQQNGAILSDRDMDLQNNNLLNVDDADIVSINGRHRFDDDAIFWQDVTGDKFRIVRSGDTVYLQTGESTTDTGAKLTIARYFTTSNIAQFDIRADTTLLAGTLDLQGNDVLDGGAYDNQVFKLCEWYCDDVNTGGQAFVAGGPGTNTFETFEIPYDCVIDKIAFMADSNMSFTVVANLFKNGSGTGSESFSCTSSDWNNYSTTSSTGVITGAGSVQWNAGDTLQITHTGLFGSGAPDVILYLYARRVV